ncbi:hypothetical protein HPB51_018252 [Rhipicephalus microplus]|uniref:Uncharacterized protein n=1 Tax=Rhipicephalus microplus TaxID=6941 RepID=A0A9J6D6W0_RHIMP|nr:hypothetical protein HPB51_018252 [Rhipicephalus microplus]
MSPQGFHLVAFGKRRRAPLVAGGPQAYCSAVRPAPRVIDGPGRRREGSDTDSVRARGLRQVQPDPSSRAPGALTFDHFFRGQRRSQACKLIPAFRGAWSLRKSPLRVTGVGGVSQAPSSRSCHSGKNVNWGKAAAGAHAPHKRQRRPRHDRDREKETAGRQALAVNAPSEIKALARNDEDGDTTTKRCGCGGERDPPRTRNNGEPGGHAETLGQYVSGQRDTAQVADRAAATGHALLARPPPPRSPKWRRRGRPLETTNEQTDNPFIIF